MSGYDHFQSKSKIQERREAKEQLKAKVKRSDKNAPREVYSKIPVSTVRYQPIYGASFDNEGGEVRKYQNGVW